MRRVLLFVSFVLLTCATVVSAQPYPFDILTFNATVDTPLVMMRNGNPVPVGSLVQVIKPGVGNILHPPELVSPYGAPTNGDDIAATFGIGDGVDPNVIDNRGVFVITLTGVTTGAVGGQLTSGNPFYIRVWATVPRTTSLPFPAGSPYADGGPFVTPSQLVGFLTGIELNPSSANPTWYGSTANPVLQVQNGLTTLSSGSPLNFGSVTVGSSQTITLTITNTGLADLIAANFLSTGNFLTFNAGLHLHPGENGTVMIGFNPSASGVRNGTFSFNHNASNAANPFTLSLTGTGNALVGPAIVVMNGSNVIHYQDSIDFGPAQTGASIQLHFSITNPGNASTTLSAFNGGAEFLTNTPAASVVAGGSATWNLTFSPSATGVRNGTVTFVHNGVNNTSPFRLFLKGTGSVAPQPWSGGNPHVATNPTPGQLWTPALPNDPNTSNNPPASLQFAASIGNQPTQITLSYTTTAPATLPPSFPTPTGFGSFHQDSIVHRYWDIQQTGGSNFNCMLDFYFTSNDVPVGVDPLSPNIHALSYNTVDHTWSIWYPVVTLYQAGTPNVYRARIFGVNAFSIWELSSQSALPVSVMTLSAIASDRMVTLRWRVETELSNAYYRIERRSISQNTDWTEIARIPSVAQNGTSATPLNYLYQDMYGLQNSMLYEYRIADVSLDGIAAIRGTVRARPVAAVVRDYALRAYPNPFNPDLHITYTIKEDTRVVLSVTNLMGQTVATLVDGNVRAGVHSLNWNASRYPSGMYFVRLQSEEFNTLRKIVFTK